MLNIFSIYDSMKKANLPVKLGIDLKTQSVVLSENGKKLLTDRNVKITIKQNIIVMPEPQKCDINLSFSGHWSSFS